ncbi:unnamed protein product [Fraxinus pennsylvanica]|uniref:F-box domain-containing protein n=1 Tax=Fraxinus pennsylvanica TaxID=56036 RepID=A0AAD1ZN84_9LAMI|nr:unnamed protein product [Fraxinus pennsylvanica]
MAANLPWDITIEILSRLPVKSLVRFKCVSKSFYSLISQNSQFQRKHLDQSTRHDLIFNLQHGPEHLFSCSLSSLSSDDHDQEGVIELAYPIKVKHSGYMTVSRSCNGLFCIQDIARIVCIWNPSTRELRRLPDCPRANDRIACSLGYDSSSDDYKVLSIHKSIIGDRAARARTVFQLISLKRDSSWRKILDLPGMKFSLHGSYDFYNGAFYWIENIHRYSGCYEPLVIASFDIKEEKIKKFELSPPTRYSDQYTVFDVSVLGGKLCLYTIGSDTSFDLWVIEEYGVMKKMLSIRVNEIRRHVAQVFKPLYLFEDGKIMLHTSINWIEQVDIYKDGDSAPKTTAASCKIRRAYICNETLISPQG